MSTQHTAKNLPRYEPDVFIEEDRGHLKVTGAAMSEKPDGRWVRLRDVEALAQAQPSLTDEQLNCGIAPQPLRYSLSDYHNAPNTGPLAFTWADKPHRLLYDLIAAVKHYAALSTQAAQPATDIDEAQIKRMTEQGAKAWAGIDAQSLRDGEQPVQARGVPDGFKLVAVNSAFDDLMYWLNRCDEKGHLENCADLIEPWAAFDYRQISAAAPSPQQAEPLSDEQVAKGKFAAEGWDSFYEGVRFAESAHGIKGAK